MRRLILMSILSLSIALAWPADSFAQRGGTTGGTGGAGSSGFSGSSASGFSSNSSTARSSTGTFGQRSLGSSAANPRSNFSGTGGGQQGAQGMQTPQQVGQLTGNERYVRGNRTAQDFVGADTTAAANFFAGMGMGGQTGQNNNLNRILNQGRNQNNQNQQLNQNQNQQNTKTQRTVRTVLTVGFDYRPQTTSSISQELSANLTKSRGVQALSPVTVEMTGRTAVLRGVVANDHARSLAERLALLEPGVAVVKNELTVSQPELSPPPTPAPRASGAVLPGPQTPGLPTATPAR